MVIAIIIVSLICIGLFIYLRLLKQQIRNISEELKKTRQDSYNKQLSVQLFDKDLTELAKQCNYNLDFQSELKRKSKRQEEASKQAISDIAHDLRTPLTVVKGNLQLIKRERQLSDKEQQYLRVCENKADELKHMIDDFFELSILESDDSKAELTSVNLNRLLMDVVLEHEILIREHGLEPEISIPEKTLFVKGNPQLLERMFGNLLGNIFKYGKERFGIRVKEQGDTCAIEFINPVATEHKIDVTHLFDRTYMADTSRHKSGTGLGLYIVKLLAEKQGAEVVAEMSQEELIITMIVTVQSQATSS